jgi:hypothetical protein
MGSYLLKRGPEPRQWYAHHSDGVTVAFVWPDDSIPPCCPSKGSKLAEQTGAREIISRPATGEQS